MSWNVSLTDNAPKSSWKTRSTCTSPLLIVVSVWLYTMVFAFSALWFAHYCLAELEALRARATADAPGGAMTDPGATAAPVAPPLLPPAN